MIQIGRRFLLGGLLLAATLASCADQAWMIGRIASVQKVDNSKTLYWIVNTPVTKDETAYTISVHLQDKIYIASYVLDKTSPPPPETWVKEHPVRLQFAGDDMYLRTPGGNDLKLTVLKRKSAIMMHPITATELAALNAESAPPAALPSLIGFDNPSDKPKAAPAPAQTQEQQPVAPEPPPLPPGGMVSVASTPYLAEVYIDNDSMGYTPAKIRLAPGKHIVRLEKAGYKTWSKEVNVTEGSELTMDATMDKKPK